MSRPRYDFSIVIDTETTGLDPPNDDRIVEIGALEEIDRS
jgi:DNA polymerase III epsilon subunit-like protein